MQPFSALADLVVSFIRADVPMREIDPYRRAGAEAYELIDQVAPASWQKVAAWNAFLLQVYGDNLVNEGVKGRYCAPELAMFAQRLYQEANVWLEEAHKAEASAAYRFRFVLPHPLQHWTGYRSDEQLRAMRHTVETGRTRAASDMERFAGAETERELLLVRLAEVDSEIHYAERLWSRRPTEQLRMLVGETLQIALDHAYEIGQLLAQPELIQRLHTRR